MARKSKATDESKLSDLENQYKITATMAERFAEEITHQLEHLFYEKNVYLSFPIQHRVKTWKSIAEKFERKSLDIKDIKELNDLVGLRIILQFRRDIQTVTDIIEENFEILEKYDTVDRLKEDQFGYSSLHFVVRLPERWLAVPTLANLNGLRAELQLRTTAQHIWAAASHTLQYKHEESVPLPVRRAIHRVSALLETVDLEFERVLEQRELYRKDLIVDSAQEMLNVDLLEKLLDSYWPAENKTDDEPYAYLLEDLLHFNIKTSGDLSELVHKHRSAVFDDEKIRIEETTVNAAKQTYTSQRLAKGVFYTHVGFTRSALKHELGEAWSSYIKITYSGRKKDNKTKE